ncbi:MAG: asparagine--tRNA ligase, partial [Mycoplasmataceae bacterium]|nr:asparagine--tRNA ligase [Mycoplasmataceae bacterium]
IGEVVGGSERESNIDIILNRLNELKISPDKLNWYLELRKYGYYKSVGFGIGFERLIMMLTGIENIRDVIAFPRYPGSLKF